MTSVLRSPTSESTAMTSACLALTDIDHIKSFIFASPHLREIRGSLMWCEETIPGFCASRYEVVFNLVHWLYILSLVREEISASESGKLFL